MTFIASRPELHQKSKMKGNVQKLIQLNPASRLQNQKGKEAHTKIGKRSLTNDMQS